MSRSAQPATGSQTRSREGPRRAYRVGVIGTGRVSGPIDDTVPPHNDFKAPYGHVTAYQQVPETEVVAAADLDEGMLRPWCERYSVSRAYADYREMIDKEDLDIVSVTTRTEARAEPIIYAADHGVRGIYAEKALCASTEELAAIAAACRRNGVQLQYGPMRRFYAGYQAAYDVLVAGEIGNVRAAFVPAASELFNSVSHFIDEALYFLDDAKPIYVHAEVEPTEMAWVDNVLDVNGDPFVRFAVVQFEHGQRLVVTDLGPGEFQITGDDGLIRSSGDSQRWVVRRFKKMDMEQETDIGFTGISGTVAKVRDLVQAIESGEPGHSNLDLAIKGMEICFGITLSAHAGGARVDFPLDRSVRLTQSRM